MLPGRLAALAIALLFAAGCLQIETTIKLHEDGTATVTERLRFSKRLLDLAKSKPDRDVSKLLTKEAALERMKAMGEGVRLASHTVRDAEQGAREAVSVFKAADINKLRYVSPYLSLPGYPKHTELTCKVFPVLTHKGRGRKPGDMAIAFRPSSGPRFDLRKGMPPASPKDLQVLRQLQPVFEDLMKNFRVKLTFESYAPVCNANSWFRGKRRVGHVFTLLSFSDQDIDKQGFNFLTNEEAMLELLRLRPGGPVCWGELKDRMGMLMRWGDRRGAGNPKGKTGNMPVLHKQWAPEVFFPPSRHYFDRYFKGKTLHFDERHGGPRPATWEAIGYQPDEPKTEDPAAVKKDE
ncbi:MAG: hypothetical protein R6V58_09280 [Planctomycetota bacterium]